MKLTSSIPLRNKALLINDHIPFWQRPDVIIRLLVILYLVLGLVVVKQYMMSVDEPHRIHYAERSLSAYIGEGELLEDEKGPFYGMFAQVISTVLVFFIRSWRPIDGWHYMSFVAFVIGIYFFYRLCRRLVNPPVALAATALFGTQPLLWGHAFINPKDIPFMAFFIASVALGLEMVDHFRLRSIPSWAPFSNQELLRGVYKKLIAEWRAASLRLRRLVIGLAALLAALVISYRLMQFLISRLITLAYNASPSSFLGVLFRQVAPSAAQNPVQGYIIRALSSYHWLIYWMVIGLCLAIFLAVLKIFPTLSAWLFEPRVLLAGCFLGFCSDIRTLGPASGLLVAVYFLFKGGLKAVPNLLKYLGIGAITIYVFWPYLWGAPVSHFLASLSEAADFPWYGTIYYGGVLYFKSPPPISYLPVLITLQFTETALVLALAGLLIAGFFLIRKADLRMDMLLLGAWLVAPIAAAILMHSTTYNNFRQFLFVVPPLFVFAALALQKLWELLKHKPALFVPLVILALLPGLYFDWQLHPYQYLYYNSLVGGVAGATRDYDVDYWNITYKEAIEYINKVAPQNATVTIWGIINTTSLYARDDLKLLKFSTSLDRDFPFNSQTDYAILTTKLNADQNYFPESKVIYEVRRAGALLTVVKQVNKGDLIQDVR
jgi:hypothetical protein